MKTGAERGTGTETNCAICGKKFKRRSIGQVYCGKSCAAKGRNNFRKTGEGRIKRYCAACGKELDPERGNKAQYCNKECLAVVRRNRTLEKQKKAMKKGRTCIVCGKHFVPEKYKDTICSEECAVRARSDCMIRIRKTGANLRADMQPKVGQTYKATRFLNRNGGGKFYVVPGFGKYGAVIKQEEAEEITTA